MGKGFFPMVLTVLGALFAYVSVSIFFKYPESVGMVAGVLTAVVISGLFSRFK